MRKYNLFVIKEDYVNFYKDNPKELYEILYKLNKMKHSFNIGINLYKQLCKAINILILKKYLNDKFNKNFDKKFYIDNVFIELKYTRIIIKSKYNYPRILNLFNCYDRNIFVCDFLNRDYFWLSSFVRSNVLQHI